VSTHIRALGLRALIPRSTPLSPLRFEDSPFYEIVDISWRGHLAWGTRFLCNPSMREIRLPFPVLLSSAEDGNTIELLVIFPPAFSSGPSFPDTGWTDLEPLCLPALSEKVEIVFFPRNRTRA